MTDKALQAIKDRQHSLGGETYLRFGMNRPCCNRMNYTFSWQAPKMSTRVLHDIKILIIPTDPHFTEQTEIDYEDDGFLIRDPNPLVSPII
jgi:Fe-S cluster assembly iron-binding protein IscA